MVVSFRFLSFDVSNLSVFTMILGINYCTNTITVRERRKGHCYLTSADSTIHPFSQHPSQNQQLQIIFFVVMDDDVNREVLNVTHCLYFPSFYNFILPFTILKYIIIFCTGGLKNSEVLFYPLFCCLLPGNLHRSKMF